MMRRTLLFSSVVAFALLVFSSIHNTAYAATSFFASPTDQGTHDCLSVANACDLQQALDAANTSNAEAIVNLSAGTFAITGSFTFQHVGYTAPLTIIGADADVTFITNTTHGMVLSSGGTIELSGINFKDNPGRGLNFSNDGVGGIYVHDNTFEGNGNVGMFLQHDTGEATLEVARNTFIDNTSDTTGGGLAVYVNSGASIFPIIISDNTFNHNTAESGAGGGASVITNAANSTFFVNGNTFDDNINITGDGGGLYIHETGAHSDIVIGAGAGNGNTFTDNTSEENGAGLYIVTTGLDSDITVGLDEEDGGNTFTGNTSTNGYGGGMVVDTDGNDAEISVSRNTVTSNTAQTSGGVYVDTNGTGAVDVTVTHNTISLNESAAGAAGAGTFYAKSTFHFEDNTIVGNTAITNAGGVDIQIDGSGGNISNNYISNNSFIENATTCGSGGAFYLVMDASGSLTMNANKVLGNSAGKNAFCTANGGGGSMIIVADGFQTVLTNNLFANNEAIDQGGGLSYRDLSSFGLSLVNSTFANNTADSDGGNVTFDFDNTGGENYLTNNIFWGGGAGSDGDDIWFESLDAANNGLSYNIFGDMCLDNGGVVCNPDDGLLGNFHESNNLNSDPVFVSSAGDYTLQVNSPAINAGDSSTDYVTDLDLNGDTRIQGAAVDMGAYEFDGARIASHRSSGVRKMAKKIIRSSIEAAEGATPILPPPASFVFTKLLKSAMSSQDVRELQKFLNAHGAVVSAVGPGSVGNETTLFGAKTRAAVIMFQKAHSLTPDGIVGPKTIAVINNI